jgi:hypothetical protein
MKCRPAEYRMEIKVEVDSKVITEIANMDEVKDKIIGLMGKNCEKYYF